MIRKRLLGVDIGGTGIKLALVEVDTRPHLVATETLGEHAEESPRVALPRVAAQLRVMMEAAGWDNALGVGVGCAGLINRDNRTVAFSPNLPAWKDADIGEILESELNLPVRVDNDVNAFAMAEWMWGAGERSANAVFLTLGTGIGAGIVANGRILRGYAGFAGEPGHATLVLGGIPCPCGNEGCAERYVGNKDIVLAARRHPEFDGDAALVKADPLTPEVLSRAAKDGSVVARDVLSDVGRALGGLLVSLVNTLNPERVVIGGGVARAGVWVIDPAREHLQRHSFVARFAPPRILDAALGSVAGTLGSAALLLEDSVSGPK